MQECVVCNCSLLSCRSTSLLPVHVQCVDADEVAANITTDCATLTCSRSAQSALPLLGDATAENCH